MFQRLAAHIRKQLNPLVDQYDKQLRTVPGYANLPESARRDLEHRVLLLVADCLEANDDSRLIQYIHERAEQVLTHGFQPEWFQQAVAIPQEIIVPLVETVEESNFVWRSFGHAQAMAWESVGRERRHIEMTLRESEARYQTIFDATPIMFWLKDTHNRTLRINKAAADFEGVKPADVEGKSAYDLYPHEQAEAFYQDDLEVIRSNQPKLGIVEQHTSVGTGKLMWVETGKTPVRDDQGEVVGVLAFGIDVTDRQQAEIKLRESEEQYRQAITAAGAVPYHIDYSTESYRFIGEAIEKLTGYHAGEITPTRLGQLIQETVMTGQGSELAREEAIQQARAGDLTGWKADYRLIDRAGQTHWLSDSSVQVLNDQGKPIGAIGILQDITERKRAEDILRHSAERQQQTSQQLRAALEAANELIQVQDLNAAFRRSVELAREKFDVERCGLYMLDESGNSLWGTYGTDDQRQTTDERNSQRTAEEFAPILTATPQQLWIVRETPHIYVEDGVQHAVGAGWVVATVLRGATGPIGILFNDCALSGRPIDEAQQEALAIYCSIIGSIIERKRLEEQVQESLVHRSVQVQTSTEVAQEIASATDLNELFRRVVTLIKERFNYYHAQLFRHEPAQDAVVLITGYGEIGQKMMETGHKLRMGRGVVGTAAATGRAILATDVTQDPDWRPNPYLPDTKGELAVPIKWRDQVLGILDVQSDRAGALTEDDRLLLEGLCGQIGIAMESKRLLDNVQQSEQLMRTLIDAIPDFIYAKDLEGRHILGNAALVQLYGLDSSADLLGKTDFDFYPRELAEQYQASERQILLEGQSLLWHEEPNVGSDGKQRWNSTTKVPLRDAQGQIIGLVGITSDITPRKQIELDLRRFKLGLDRSTAAIFITDTNGVITYVNPAFEKIYGYSRDEALGQTPRIIKSGLIPQEQYQHFWGALLAGQTVAGEIINKAKDGRLVPVQGSNSAIEDEQGNTLGFLALHNDITERKQAEDALRRNEAQLSEALKIAKLGYWEYDVEKDLFHFNDQFYSIFHTTAEQAGGYQISSAQYAQQFVYPDDLPIVGAEIEKALNSTDRHYSRQLEHRMLYADGGVGYISVSINIDRDEQGRILRYYGANQDVTQGKLAEQEFLRFRQGLEQASDAVFMTDVSGHIIYVNPAFEKIYGYSRDEALGQTPRILKSGQLSQEFYRTFWQSLLNKQSVSGEKPNKTKDGRVIIVEDSNSPILDSSGALLGFLSTHRDITERKHTEKELERSATLLRTIINTSRDLIYVKDTNSRFLIASQAVARLLGAPTADDLIGKNDYDFFSYELAHKYYTDEQEIIQAGEPLIDIEEPSAYPDGTKIWLSTTKIPYRSPEGKLEGIVGIGRDITEHKRSEQQMEETLRETERLYAAVSHENWQTYRQTGQLGEGYLFDQALIQPAGTMWEPEIAQALEQQALVASQSGQRAVAVTPLSVRGEAIGALGVYDDPAHPLNKEDLDLIEAVSEQVALALESARLFDQTQRDAEREHTINRVTSRIRNARSVDEVLTIAAQELRLATRASRSVVEILPTADQPVRTGDGEGVTA